MQPAAVSSDFLEMIVSAMMRLPIATTSHLLCLHIVHTLPVHGRLGPEYSTEPHT